MKADGTQESGSGRRLLKVAAWMLLAAMLLSAALVAAWIAWDAPMRHAVLTLDDAPLALANLPGGSALLAFVMAFVGVLVSATVVLLVVLLVVPLAVLLPLLLVGLVCAAGMLALALVLALLLSPLLLSGWAVWRLSRPRRAVATITP